MGGARNLKLGGNGARTRHRGNICSTWAICQLFFNCCVHQKDIAGSRGRGPLYQGLRAGGQSFPEAETAPAPDRNSWGD